MPHGATKHNLLTHVTAAALVESGIMGEGLIQQKGCSHYSTLHSHKVLVYGLCIKCYADLILWYVIHHYIPHNTQWV